MSQFVGYACVTDELYDMGYCDEVVQAGAFTKTLRESPDVHFNLVHGDGGSGLPIARTGENMTLTEDSRGLRVEADLDDGDPDVQLLSRKVQNGLIDGMSFAFRITRGRWEADFTLRRILEASLHQGDVTVCPQGANPSAGVVSLRSAGALARLRTPGRDTASQRQTLAEQLGQTAVMEFRAFELNGAEYDLSGGRRPVARRSGRSRANVTSDIIALPDYTTRARLDLARAGSPRRKAGRTEHELVVQDIRAGVLGDPVALAKRDLANALRTAR